MRDPSPPLPPSPSRAVPNNVRTSQQPPSAGSQQTSPTSPPGDQQQQGLKRVDSSRTPPHQPQQRQPIKDAVTDAFEHSPENNQLNNLNNLDPEYIKNITEQVIKNILSQQTQLPQPPPPQQTQEPRSPTQNSVDSSRARFTPPTPERNQEARDDGVASPSPVPSDAGSNVSRQSRASIRSNDSGRNGDTPKPFQADSTSRVPQDRYTSRRRSGTIPQTQERMSRESSGYGNNTAREQTPYRRNSKESDYGGASRSQVRQPREDADTGETPLEKFWQPLFIDGNPTMRLSQFLRGLALHLIDDYEPKGSLVVTPAKMLRFFEETKVEDEHYPWDTIFGGKLTPVSISLMFQKLRSQHHLIQDRYDRAPTVPGLTPYGFDWFMTCLIQAHPDTEYERLAKATMNMPISNADNKSERFPKELSRRLLPPRANIQAEQRLVSSLDHEPHVFATLRGQTQMPPPPSNPPPMQNNGERERQPYSQSSQQSNSFDDEDLNGPPPTAFQERERKPYTAREGTGKQYDDGRPMPAPYQQEGSQNNSSRPSRTNSGLPGQAMYGSSGPSDPVNIPSRHPHRLSGSAAPPPMMNGGYSRSGRRSPPPMRNSFARSEPDFGGSMPGSVPNPQYGANLQQTASREQYPPPGPDDIREEQIRRYRSRSRADRPGTLSSNEDEMNGRGYPIPGRSVPVTSGYEYGAGAVGGPPIGSDPRQSAPMHPVGSFPARRPTMGPGSSDDRRRSMYASQSNLGLGGDGGTDGYGSFAGGMNGGPGYPQQQPYGTSAQH